MAFRLREDIRTALPQLPANWYQTIYADPPWDETGGGKICRGAQNHYGLMKQKDLLALAPQVKRITAPAAHLYLWVTNTFLEDGLELARAWGFEYKTLITWAKDRFGIGQYFRGQTEQCIFAVKGVLPYKVEDGKRQQGRTLLQAPRMEHSAKPVGMREMIERVSYGPKLEFFGRSNVPMDWDAIGLELEDAQVSDGMLFDKRDPPQTDSVITPEQALIYWITGLQTEQEYDLPSIRVKGMDDPNDWTEIDLHNDDPTNLTDGTWTEPIMVTDEE